MPDSGSRQHSRPGWSVWKHSLAKTNASNIFSLANDSESWESWLMWHYAGPIVGGLRLLLLFL